MTNNKNEGQGVLIIEDDTFFAEILEKKSYKKGVSCSQDARFTACEDAS